MATVEALQFKGRDGAISLLNNAIETLNITKEASSTTPAKAVFGSVSGLLTMTRDSMPNERDYVEVGLACAEVCQTLDRALGGRTSDELSQSVLGAIGQLTTTVATMQRKIVEQGKRNAASRLFHAKSEKDTITAWKQDLMRVLQVFNIELAINTHIAVADMHRHASASQKGVLDQHCSTSASIPLGESPPPPPRVCFGRDGLIKDIVGLAENHEPIALVGAAGIGKTSVALAVLHHNRIKDQFGDNRRFIRCDQFPPSRAHFLSRLSKAIGAGVDNPEDLTPLRSFLASTEMVLFLDTAESILDPQGAEAQGIYSIVEELSRFSNICLGITSRISTVPPNCKRPAIPMLTMDAARDVFYSICSNGERSAVINDLLRRLDFHALSITLLATTASHNMWDCDEVVAKWDVHRTQVLRTDFNESLAATIELSLASPTFQGLGPEARDLLGVIAFFPQGIDKRNLDWLFPTISDVGNTFDKFCVLSLTHRCGSFITMLAPIRDYLCPQDPKSSLFLSITKDHYFNRLLTGVHPNVPNFETTQWIMSEDVNVEHLLDVFTSVDTCSRDVWVACTNFMAHLYWHKPRLVILGPKIEGLPDNHGDKPECLFQLSRLFGSVGNFLERKRLLIHTLKLEGWQWGDSWVAGILRQLSDANRLLHLREEGIMQAKEALGIFERLGNTIGQASCLSDLASLLYEDEQLDAAKEAAFRAIELLPAEREEYLMCRSHHLLGDVYYSKGEREKAIHHFEVALGIASLSNWHDRLFWIHYSLAELFLDEDEFDDAHAHIGEAKSHVIDDAYGTGRATSLQAEVWYHQGRLEEARFETSRAIAIFERLGATDDLEMGSELLRAIEDSGKAFGEPDFSAHLSLSNISMNNSEKDNNTP